MRTILVSLLLLGSLSCLTSPAAGSPSAPPPEAGSKPWTIMPLEQAPVMFAQCSRPAPREKEGPFWSPSPAQIEELEKELPAYLRQQGHAEEADGLARSLRQYVGFVRAGRKLIYLNVFPVSLLESEKEACRETREVKAKEFCEPDHWRHAAVLVCDGGADFWGLEYDPESKAFSALEFNAMG